MDEGQDPIAWYKQCEQVKYGIGQDEETSGSPATRTIMQEDGPHLSLVNEHLFKKCWSDPELGGQYSQNILTLRFFPFNFPSFWKTFAMKTELVVFSSHRWYLLTTRISFHIYHRNAQFSEFPFTRELSTSRVSFPNGPLKLITFWLQIHKSNT